MSNLFKQVANEIIQYTVEQKIYPWYEKTFYKKAPELTRRDEIAAQIEQALTQTVWILKEDEEGDSALYQRMKIEMVQPTDLDTGGFVLTVLLMSDVDPMRSEGSYELSDFLRNFKPVRDLEFSDLNS